VKKTVPAAKRKVATKKAATALLKLDLGCGKNKREGFFGVDSMKFEGVDQVLDLRKPWPWKDASVEEVHCSHFIEHLTWPERVHFFNELDRVLAPGGRCTLIFPHWNSCRFYGDPTHQAPISEFAFYYLNKSWRESQAPHVGYKCNFDAQWAYIPNPSLAGKNQEYVMFAFNNYKEAIMDIQATLTKLAE